MPEAVLSNTSPLQYLHQLGQLHLLPDFYHQITIPPAVEEELARGRVVGVSLPVPASLPWIQVHTPRPPRGALVANALGRGEREVLALALETSNVLVLLDDGRALST